MNNAIKYRNTFISRLGCGEIWATDTAIISIQLEIKSLEDTCAKLHHFGSTDIDFSHAQRILFTKLKLAKELLTDLQNLNKIKI